MKLKRLCNKRGFIHQMITNPEIFTKEDFSNLLRDKNMLKPNKTPPQKKMEAQRKKDSVKDEEAKDNVAVRIIKLAEYILSKYF
jgi:hypothetical protein